MSDIDHGEPKLQLLVQFAAKKYHRKLYFLKAAEFSTFVTILSRRCFNNQQLINMNFFNVKFFLL